MEDRAQVLLDGLVADGELLRHLGVAQAQRDGRRPSGPHTRWSPRGSLSGPSLLRADEFEQALTLANDTAYTLTGGLFSRSPVHIRRAADELRAGNLYVNRAITEARSTTRRTTSASYGPAPRSRCAAGIRGSTCVADRALPPNLG